jgi:hypothetical protein
MELHDVIVECAKYSALDPLERPREEVSGQGLPATLWPRYSNIGNFISCILLARTSLTFLHWRCLCVTTRALYVGILF